MKRSRIYAFLALAATPVVAGSLFLLSARPAVTTHEPPVHRPAAAAALPKQPVAKAAHLQPAVAQRLAAPFSAPIADASERVTKKPFGIEIHPETSPVPNDRFNGFHVGVDFETFPEEKDADVAVTAICDGPLAIKKYASGYGGVAVQRCRLGGGEITVIYGHLRLSSILPIAGDELSTGDRVGLLGRGESEETDGVRKHLHLGIHKGPALDIRGYVKERSETDQWLNALDYMSL